MSSELLEAKLANLPAKPGVYLFKSSGETVIYIGKAKSLRSRVRSYFREGSDIDPKTAVLRKEIVELEYIATDSDVEALILESNLVKRHQPRFNVNLKDDKAFLHIKLTVQEDFPRVLLTRRVLDDGALYFGPYLPAALARNTVKLINRYFLLRTCDLDIDGRQARPCLEHHIHRCLGPCVEGLCTRDEYQRAVKEVILLLEGKNEQLVSALTAKMMAAAQSQFFETAALCRDRIQMVRDLAERQKMVLSGKHDVDVFAYHRQGPRLALQLFTLREGQVVGKREFFWEDLEFFHPPQFLRDALQQYYLSAGFVPGEIHVPVELEDSDLIAEWLSRKSKSPSRRVRIVAPRRGDKHELLLLVEENARIAFDTRFRIFKPEKQVLLERLQKELELADLPRRIEAFDVSNIQGAESVAALVVCDDAVMRPQQYRKFRIKTVKGADDFASIAEAVHRRYRRLAEEGAALPNLVLIDGGKGQLHAAYQALSRLGLEEIGLASLAKRDELVYLEGQAEPIALGPTSPVLHLLQEIRDEAHRFAVQYHRRRRSMRDFASELDQVPGVGQKRRMRLLRQFGSVNGIRRATVEELAPFVGVKLARLLKEKLA
jgi:excinuclease ABC subunit C